MVEEGGIGVGTHPLATPLDEQPRLAAAVRETVHRRIVDLLQRGGLLNSPDLLPCPMCGESVILLDFPSTYVFLPDAKMRICAPCGAERDLIRMIRPDTDIGGEG